MKSCKHGTWLGDEALQVPATDQCQWRQSSTLRISEALKFEGGDLCWPHCALMCSRRSPEQLLTSARLAADSERLRQASVNAQVDKCEMYLITQPTTCAMAFVIPCQALEFCTEGLDLLWGEPPSQRWEALVAAVDCAGMFPVGSLDFKRLPFHLGSAVCATDLHHVLRKGCVFALCRAPVAFANVRSHHVIWHPCIPRLAEPCIWLRVIRSVFGHVVTRAKAQLQEQAAPRLLPHLS